VASAKKNKKLGICAVCGHRRHITREHVPPKNLFLPPRPKNTITAPVCERCNHGSHLDDEYFRVFVSCVSQPGTLLRRLWTEKVVGSSFVRGGGLQRRLNDDHAKFVAQHQREPVRFANNAIIPDELIPLVQPFSVARVAGLVGKMVRCLHFHEADVPLPKGARFEVSNSPLGEMDALALYETPTGLVGHNSEFYYFREVLNNERSRWLLGFYRVHTFEIDVSLPANNALERP
jgi:hypothetical protein